MQTTPGVSSEVNVFRTLVDSSPHTAETENRLEVLLVQGVDAGRPSGTDAASAFSSVPDVRVLEIPMGRLGRNGLGLIQRATKVVDVGQARIGRRHVLGAAREFDPHIVYSAQQRWDQRIAVPLAKQLQCPRVVHLHYTVGPWLGSAAVDALRNASMVIGVSDFICNNAVEAGVDPARVRTLYNAAIVSDEQSESERSIVRKRVRSELSLPPETLLVGMVGRLSESKCQIELLQAMVPILRESHDVHLLFAGTEWPAGNGLSEQLRSSAERAGVEKQVHLLGQRNDVDDLLDAFDVFAHPTLQEPCALSVLEAMAHGVPMVAWRDGGTSELVVDGETGLLVPPLDIDALSSALRRLLEDAPLRVRLGRAARRRADESFRPEVAASRFRELLSTLRSGAG